MKKISAIIPAVLAACLVAPAPAGASTTGPSCVAALNYIHKSTSTGTAPTLNTASKLATNVKQGMITSSP